MRGNRDDMDWDKLRVFHAVAEAGSFTHAGEELGLSQSAVSRQISGLGGKVRAIQNQNQQFREPNIRATGHSATFQNTSHFFPGR